MASKVGHRSDTVQIYSRQLCLVARDQGILRIPQGSLRPVGDTELLAEVERKGLSTQRAGPGSFGARGDKTEWPTAAIVADECALSGARGYIDEVAFAGRTFRGHDVECSRPAHVASGRAREGFFTALQLTAQWQCHSASRGQRCEAEYREKFEAMHGLIPLVSLLKVRAARLPHHTNLSTVVHLFSVGSSVVCITNASKPSVLAGDDPMHHGRVPGQVGRAGAVGKIVFHQ